MIGAFDRQTHPTRMSLRFDKGELLLKQFDGFQLWLGHLDFAVFSGMIAEDQHKPHLTNFMREKIRPGMTVLDIGVNIGAHTMPAASLVGENGRVLAFEPNSENCRMILLSLAENGFESNVSHFPMALSDKTDVIWQICFAVIG
ncbi:FkbM family methyltransferase [Prodigiosinella confusarubida]|uniref:FkbM family methyltransferase n=1 Tax=Serratia sp. (strain ATCC 39006) TaxID=104623 RepID=A0A2I5T8T4_SERS3|nr:FkbM family methyltransferase [Serratia sp. ATCC 39006]AUH00985.1 FkbM family methyltransferase [Serratia sp. ATCC 39006]AUH05306.1 FkbM family methyltransferase [Serratia sp. ATCC 39006]